MANDSTNDEVQLWFQYQAGRNTWAAFPWGANALITKAFREGKAKTKVMVDSAPLDIKLSDMLQVNCTTKYEKSIRCLVGDDQGYYVWQWQKTRRRWDSYPCDSTLKLEEAFIGDQKEPVKVRVDGSDCVIDITKMEQSNTTKNSTETVQRLSVDFTPPPKEDIPEPVPEPEPSPAGDAAATKAGKPAAKSGRKRAIKGEGDQKPAKIPKSEIKTVRLTGHAAPVDIECVQMQGKAHVFQEGHDVYDAMLNQTNLANNNNKYYLLQLLQDNSKKDFYVWFRWGRVGLKGQNNLTPCGTNLDKAKETFINKFWDKTKNEWSERGKFSKVKGKYDLLKMDYTAETKGDDEPDAGENKDKPKPASKLDKRVQDLITLICNIQAMEDMVVEMKYDAQKAPLGKLTSQQIKAGYAALKKVEKCHEKKDSGRALVQACDEFYTRIPHNFGMQRPPVIRTRDDLKAKLTLLEALGDIQVAMTVLKGATNVNEHPVDRQYHALKCGIEPVEKTNPNFKMVEKYMLNTHAITHNQYKMELMDLYELDKEGETKAFSDLGNKKLLWHGSRLTNWAGILGQGLRIAPPEAPVTGYMFGKGVYFADMSSKSCNYCFATPSKNVGVALLSEVSLGVSNKLLAADYNADKLPAGKNSVMGLGKIAPDATGDTTMPDGTVVPLGKSKSTGVTNPDGYTLNYNEFVVYDTKQIKMKYLVKIKFKFN